MTMAIDTATSNSRNHVSERLLNNAMLQSISIMPSANTHTSIAVTHAYTQALNMLPFDSIINHVDLSEPMIELVDISLHPWLSEVPHIKDAIGGEEVSK